MRFAVVYCSVDNGAQCAPYLPASVPLLDEARKLPAQLVDKPATLTLFEEPKPSSKSRNR